MERPEPERPLLVHGLFFSPVGAVPGGEGSSARGRELLLPSFPAAAVEGAHLGHAFSVFSTLERPPRRPQLLKARLRQGGEEE